MSVNRYESIAIVWIQIHPTNLATPPALICRTCVNQTVFRDEWSLSSQKNVEFPIQGSACIELGEGSPYHHLGVT